MTKPFYERLRTYFTEIGTVLRGEASAASIFPNSTDIGISRERIYAEILRFHLPSSCNILFGGFLFNQDGNESRQIDILVSSASSLQFNFHNRDGGGKSFTCVDGCLAIVSLKSTLDSRELCNALENIASVPDKEPLGSKVVSRVPIVHYDQWPYKIIYASNGNSLEQIMQTLDTFYQEHPDISVSQKPNLIHVAGKYCIVRILPGGDSTIDGKPLPGNTFWGYTEGRLPGLLDAYALFMAISNIQSAVAASNHILYNYTKMTSRLAVST